MGKEMAAHTSILAWKVPRTEELGRVQSTGSQSRGQLSDFTSLCLMVTLVKEEQRSQKADGEATQGLARTGSC